MNIALVGCGRITKNHFKAILNNGSKCNLKAICDNSLKRLSETREFLSEFCAKTNKKIPDFVEYDDYENLINEIKSGVLEVQLIVLTSYKYFLIFD